MERDIKLLSADYKSVWCRQYSDVSINVVETEWKGYVLLDKALLRVNTAWRQSCDFYSGHGCSLTTPSLYCHFNGAVHCYSSRKNNLLFFSGFLLGNC